MTALDPFGRTDSITGKPDFRRHKGTDQPYVVPAGATKGQWYTRMSQLGEPLANSYLLDRRNNRHTAYGMLDHDLRARLVAIGEPPSGWSKDHAREVDDVVATAQHRAGAFDARDLGTYIHSLVERINLGKHVDGGQYEADLEAYRQIVAELGWVIEPQYVECKLACDALRGAGTADVLPFVPSIHMRCIADLKTGTSVEFGVEKHACQLAGYANSDLYDPTDDSRTPLDVSTEVGYLIHLPAGQGRCSIYEVDLVAGFKAARLANTVTAVRKAAKGWATKVHEVAA